MTQTGSAPADTRDALLGGEVVLWQPGRGAGYRFNLDPVLLAGFVRPTKHAIDLGAGCGVIGLLLLSLGKAERVSLVECQADLARCARRNIADNDVADRAAVLEGDLRQLELPTADSVVFNPPYFAAGSGRRPPDPGRSAGRHETHGGLGDFVRTALGCLTPGGVMCAIVRAERAAELEAAVNSLGAAVTRRRAVMPRAGDAARHLMLEAGQIDDGQPATTAIDETPLIVHAGADRTYSDEVRALLRE